MKLKEIINERADITAVEDQLRKLGYTEFKRKSGKRTAGLVPGNRIQVMQHIVANLPGSEINTSPSSASSIGHIEYDLLPSW